MVSTIIWTNLITSMNFDKIRWSGKTTNDKTELPVYHGRPDGGSGLTVLRTSGGANAAFIPLGKKRRCVRQRLLQQSVVRAIKIFNADRPAAGAHRCL